MYIAKLRIINYRCFEDQTVEFCPGLNVLIGENNAGKTTVIAALGLVLDQRHRRRLTYFDFHQPITNTSKPPRTTITVTFRSTTDDTIDDKALVADWLTKLDPPWEATLTYTYGLEPEDETVCIQNLKVVAEHDVEEYRNVVETFLSKYVGRTAGGDPTNALPADREMLEKVDFQMLDALRDADRELFAGTNPLLKRILRQIRDAGKTTQEQANNDKQFRHLSTQLGAHLRSRVSLDPFLSFVTDTGALEGGKPTLKDEIGEDDILSALRLYVEEQQLSIPAERNGLGYNNLIYISLILASIDHGADPAKQGPNATSFPILCIEEPEAHLHPALQYKLLKHLQERVKPRQKVTDQRTRQVFITTHSTHITSASGLDQLTCFTIPAPGVHGVAYPGRCFPNDSEGKASKAYVERYLDATKSNLLFSKGVILVEGLAELLLLPVISDRLGCSLATYHVAIISVGGLTFRHFLPLFGAGVTTGQAQYALRRPVACLVDADPARKTTESHFKTCWPYQLDRDTKYEYRASSPAVTNLEALSAGCENVIVRHTMKTLEYDLAYHNYSASYLVTTACTNAKELKELIEDPSNLPALLAEKLGSEDCADLEVLSDAGQQERHRVASCYLQCIEQAKGEHAFALAQQLKSADPQQIAVPSPIEDVIRHAARRPKPMDAAKTAPA